MGPKEGLDLFVEIFKCAIWFAFIGLGIAAFIYKKKHERKQRKLDKKR